jgi:hypothetical protein
MKLFKKKIDKLTHLSLNFKEPFINIKKKQIGYISAQKYRKPLENVPLIFTMVDE